jgi:hypothetical protein
VITLRRRRWVQHVACIGEKRNAYKIMSRKLMADTIWKIWAQMEG